MLWSRNKKIISYALVKKEEKQFLIVLSYLESCIFYIIHYCIGPVKQNILA